MHRTMDLPDFLRARLAAEETAARSTRRTRATARTLAECEAKRRIVALHDRTRSYHDRVMGGRTCAVCRDDDGSPASWPCETLRLLALPYADHPDFDESWRPDR